MTLSNSFIAGFQSFEPQPVVFSSPKVFLINQLLHAKKITLKDPRKAALSYQHTCLLLIGYA